MSIKQCKYSLLIFLTLLLTIIIGPQNTLADTTWQNVGSPGFSTGMAYDTSIALDSNGTPYVVYSDGVNSWKATVMNFNSSEWHYVGSPGFSVDGADYTSIALDSNDTPYVAYCDYGNSGKATVMKYNGSSWVTVGSPGFSADGAHFTEIALDSSGTPYAAYSDGGNSYKATVMKYNGSSWQPIGNAGFSAGGAGDTKIALDSSGTPYVAYGDGGNSGKTTVMKYPIYKVSGKAISSSGLAMPGVTITFTKVSGDATPVPAPVTTAVKMGAWSQIGFVPGNTYKVTPSKAGYTFTPSYLTFSTASTTLNFIGTAALPAVSSYSPKDNATGVARTTNLVLAFNQTVSAVSGKNIYIKKTADNTIVETIPVTDTTRVTVSGGKVTINPTTTLTANTGYYVLISSGAFKGVNGGLSAGITTKTIWNFTTATATPLVSSYSPVDNATGVARTSNLVLSFNQNVSAVSGKNIYIKKTADNTIVETIPVTDTTRVTVASNKITINPTATLTANTGYYVLISSGAFKGVNGGLFAGITSKTIWNFTTSAS